MSDPWMKFYPSDWRADPMLRMCSLAARGLWTEMMCIMHEAEPYGHLLVNGRPLNEKQLASLSGGDLRETINALAELESCGVFSKSETGVIFSRRMKRDKERALRDKANGKGGGNPRLKAGVNPQVKAEDKAQIPEARYQKPDEDSSLRSLDDWPEDFKEKFWSIYPKRVGKKAALNELDRVRKRGDVPWAKLIAALTVYAATADPQFTKDPERWLKKGCWDDEPDMRKAHGKPTVSEAIRSHIEGGISFGPKPQLIPSATSGGPPRLLSEGGRPRPGDVHGSGGRDLVRIYTGSNPACDGPEDGAGAQDKLAADRRRG